MMVFMRFGLVINVLVLSMYGKPIDFPCFLFLLSSDIYRVVGWQWLWDIAMAMAINTAME